MIKIYHNSCTFTVIPENKIYSFNLEAQEFEENEIIYIERVKTQNNFISEIDSYAIENKYISDKKMLL